MQHRRGPNIVFVLADDMGYGDFGRVNGGQSRTPALDALMDEGTTFTQHYSASPVCAPARAAILTGRYPQRSGVIDTLEARGTDRLALHERTLADELRAAGYRTGLAGKWHSGAIGVDYHPLRRGFEEFAGFRGGWQDYWDWTIEAGGRSVPADGRYLTDVIAEEAVGFLRRHRDEPFFLHVAFNAPHFPFEAPEEEVEAFLVPGRSRAVATIYAMIAIMDRGVGRILGTLAELGLEEDTIVVFTSDNGPQLDGTGESSTVRFNAGLAGQKQHVSDGGIRLPLILRWPGRVAAGAASDLFVHGTDWLPTLLDLAGVARTGTLPLDGRSIGGAILAGSLGAGPASAAEPERCWQWTRYRPTLRSNAAIRDGRWKLVHPAIGRTLGLEPRDQADDELIKRFPDRFPEPVDGEVPDYDALPPVAPQLFDLAADPGETTDLAQAEPARVRALEARLAGWFEEVETERTRING